MRRILRLLLLTVLILGLTAPAFSAGAQEVPELPAAAAGTGSPPSELRPAADTGAEPEPPNLTSPAPAGSLPDPPAGAGDTSAGSSEPAVSSDPLPPVTGEDGPETASPPQSPDQDRLTRTQEQVELADAPPAGQAPLMPEDYDIPDGTALIVGTDTPIPNTIEKNALQIALEKAVIQAAENGEPTIRISLTKGTYEGGLTLQKVEDPLHPLENQELNDALDALNGTVRLQIYAEDAVNPDGSFHANADGSTVLEGDVFIDHANLELCLAGIYLATNSKVTVNAPMQLKIYGTARDDRFQVDVQGSQSPSAGPSYPNVHIDTGPGDDALEVRLRPKAETGLKPNSAWNPIRSREDAQAMGVEQELDDFIAQSLKTAQSRIGISKYLVNILGGTGSDQITVTLKDPTTAAPPGVAAQVGMHVTMVPMALTIWGDEAEVHKDRPGGSDRITLRGESSFNRATAAPVYAYIADRLYAGDKTYGVSPIRIADTQGHNVVTLDSSLAYGTLTRLQLQLDSAPGDRIHLTGHLDPSRSDSMTEVEQDGMAVLRLRTIRPDLLDGLDSRVLDIPYRLSSDLTMPVTVTDELLGKTTQEITSPEQLKATTFRRFVNYILRESFLEACAFSKETYCRVIDLGDQAALRYAPEDGSPHWFSNLILDAGRTPVELRQVELPGPTSEGVTRYLVNLIVKSSQILVSGTVGARNVILEAVGSESPEPGEDASVSQGDDTLILDQVLSQSRQDITVTGTIRANQSIELLARTRMTQDLAPEEDGGDVNALLVKLPVSTISAEGRMMARSIALRTLVEVGLKAGETVLARVFPIFAAVVRSTSTVSAGAEKPLVLTGYGDALRSTLLSASTEVTMSGAAGGLLPFSLAAAAADLETRVLVRNAQIRTDSLELSAHSRLRASYLAEGRINSMISTKAHSGVNLGGLFIEDHTAVEIRDPADLQCRDLIARSFSTVHSELTTLSSPDQESITGITAADALDVIIKVVSAVKDYVKDMKLEKAQAQAAANLQQAASAAQKTPQEDPMRSQYMGAFSMGFLRHSSQVILNTGVRPLIRASMQLHALGEAVSRIRADGSTYKAPSSESSGGFQDPVTRAAGAGIALSHYGNECRSHLTVHTLWGRDGLTVDRLSLLTDLGSSGSSCIAKAGHTPGGVKLGLAGALAVHTAKAEGSAKLLRSSQEGEAVLRSSEDTNSDNPLECISLGRGKFETVADASGKRSRPGYRIGGQLYIPTVPPFNVRNDSTGVGAGIAFGLIGVDLDASLDQVTLLGRSRSRIILRADYQGREYLEAAAGSQGGKSISPAVAVNAAGTSTTASLNHSTGLTAGLVEVEASGRIARRAIADAQAAGVSVGAGGAFGLTLLNDSADAYLAGSNQGQALNVLAQSLSTLNQLVKASSAGVPGKGKPGVKTTDDLKKMQADDQAQQQKNEGSVEKIEQATDGSRKSDGEEPPPSGSDQGPGQPEEMAKQAGAAAQAMAGDVGSKNVSAASVQKLNAARKPAQTAEGNVQAAAAMAFCVRENSSRARIAEQTTQDFWQSVSLTARNDSSTTVTANASAVSSLTGLGVAAAVSTVSYVNEALAGASAIHTQELLIRANGPEKVPLVHKIITNAISGAGASNVGVAGALALTELNGSSLAALTDQIGEPEHNISKLDRLRIHAGGIHTVMTTASASADMKGWPVMPGSSDDRTKLGVGASAAIAMVNTAVRALLGSSRLIYTRQTGPSEIIAQATDNVATKSAAGSDPLAARDLIVTENNIQKVVGKPGPDAEFELKKFIDSNAVTAKDLTADASVALNLVGLYEEGQELVGNRVHAIIHGSSRMNCLDSLVLKATQDITTTANASAFAVEGGTAAIGATGGINVSKSDVRAEFLPDGQAEASFVQGNLNVEAVSRSQDSADAIASVSGLCLNRYWNRLQSILGLIKDPNRIHNVVNAEAMNVINRVSTKVLGKVHKALEGHSTILSILERLSVQLPPIPGQEPINGKDAAGKPQSTTIQDQLRNDKINPAQPNINGKPGDPKVQPQGQPVDETAKVQQKVGIAAAVAVNITEHYASARVGNVKIHAAQPGTGNVTVLGQCDSNFHTQGSGAAITAGKGANNISLGLAVAVNTNEAAAEVHDRMQVEAADDPSVSPRVQISALLTQNLHKNFISDSSVKALAGSAAGPGAKAGMAGSAAILHSCAAAVARLAGQAPQLLCPRANVTIQAIDHSKMAAKAGQFNGSGSMASLGAAFALIYGENQVEALMDPGTLADTRSLTLNAETRPVDLSLYEPPVEFKGGITVNETDPKQKGLINLNIHGDKENKDFDVSAEVRMSTEELLKLEKFLNLFSTHNLYCEAVGGSLAISKDAKAALAGSVALAFTRGLTQSRIGADSTIHASAGSVEILAANQTNGVAIGGGAALTNQAAVGLSAAAVNSEDRTLAILEDRVTIDAGTLPVEHVTLRANGSRILTAVTVAAGLALKGVGAGGSITVLVPLDEVSARIGSGSTIRCSGTLQQQALHELCLTLVSLSAQGGAKAAPGGTVAVIYADTQTQVSMENARIEAKKLQLQALSQEQMVNVLASLSGSTGQLAMAGTIGVTVSDSDTAVRITCSDLLIEQDVEVLAQNESRHYVILPAAAGSTGSAALGASVNACVFLQSVQALLQAPEAGNRIQAGGDILVNALADDTVVLVTAAGAAASSAGIAGAVPVVYSENTVHVDLAGPWDLRAGQNIQLGTDLRSGLYTVAAGLGGASSVGAGASLNTMILSNSVLTTIGDRCSLLARAASPDRTVSAPNRNEKRRGILISAYADSDLVMVTVSGAAAGSAAVAGSVNTLVYLNTVKAAAGRETRLTAGYEDHDSETLTGDGDAEISLTAEDGSHLWNVAGGFSGSGSAAIGTTVVVLTYLKDVAAETGPGSALRSSGSIHILASSLEGSDRSAYAAGIYLLGISGSGSGAFSGNLGSNVLVVQNQVHSILRGTAEAAGSISIHSQADSALYSILISLGGSGSVAVIPMVLVTVFEGEIQSLAADGSRLTAGGAVDITSSTREYFNSDVMGLTGSGVTSVALGVIANCSRQLTMARTGDSVTVKAASLAVLAKDEVDSLSISGVAGISATAGAAIAAGVNVLQAGLEASLGRKNHITTTGTGNVTVRADGTRELAAYCGNASGGQGGGGISVLVNVVGGMLTQDAADLLAAPDSTGHKTGFDPAAFQQQAQAAAHSAAAGDWNLERYFAGDGVRQGNASLGRQEQDPDQSAVGSFDGTGGYRSPEFTNNTGKPVKLGENPELAQDFTPNPGENRDLEQASRLGQKTPDYVQAAMQQPSAPHEDSADHETVLNRVLALVGSDTVIRAGGDFSLEAQERISSDTVNVTVSGGLFVGASMGASVTVLFSNVYALTDRGSSITAGRDIHVSALTAPIYREVSQDEAEALGKHILQEEEQLASRSLRAITAGGGAGIGGVAVSVSSLTFYTNTRAITCGRLQAGRNLAVQADSRFDHLLAGTIGGTAGGIAVTGNVSLVIFKGRTEARILGIQYSEEPVIQAGQDVDVTALTKIHGISACCAGAVALGAVNGGLALVRNENLSESSVDQDTVLKCRVLRIQNKSDTLAKAYLVDVSAGVIAGTLNGAVTILNPTVLSFAGSRPGLEYGHPTGMLEADSCTILSDVQSEAISKVNSVKITGFAGSGTVLLSFNHTNAKAALDRVPFRFTTLSIYAILEADASSRLNNLDVAGGSMGLSVSYVRMSADCQALLDMLKTTGQARTITVRAGSPERFNRTTAQAEAMAGTVALSGSPIHTAAADNDSSSTALVRACQSVTVQELSAEAMGNADAFAKVTGLSAALGVQCASFAGAFLRNVQEAMADGAAVTDGGTVTVRSICHKGTTGTTENIPAGFRANAVLQVGKLPAILNAELNVALAKNQARSAAILRNITGSEDQELQQVLVLADSQADALARVIHPENFDALCLGFYSSFAYNQADFLAAFDSSTLHSRSTQVKNEYTSTADALLQPWGFHGSLSGIAFDTNVCVAHNALEAHARASDLDLTGPELTVLTVGAATAHADAHSAVLVDIDSIAVTVNLAFSELSASQSASIRDGSRIRADQITVKALMNGGSTPKLAGQEAATALVGSLASKATDLQFISGNANVAHALVTAQSRAYLLDSTVLSPDTEARLTVVNDASSTARALIGTATQVSALLTAITHTKAQAAGTYEAYVSLSDREPSKFGGHVEIQNLCHTASQALTGQYSREIRVTITGAEGRYNRAHASADSQARAWMHGSDGSEIGGSITVRALGTGSSRTGVQEPSVALDLINVVMNDLSSHWNAHQEAYLEGSGTMTAGGPVEVSSRLNDLDQARTRDQRILGHDASGQSHSLPVTALAQVMGSAGTSIKISGISGDYNRAEALSSSLTEAWVHGFRLLKIGGDLTVRALSSGAARAEALFGSQSVLHFGGMKTHSSACDSAKVSLGHPDRSGHTNVEARSATLLASGESQADSVSFATCQFELSGVTVKNISAYADIGLSSGPEEPLSPKQVHALIHDTSLKTVKSVLVDAVNRGHAEALLQSPDTALALITDVSDTELPTRSSFDTRTGVLAGSSIQSGGSISIRGFDRPWARSRSDYDQIGVFCSCSSAQGKNLVDSFQELAIRDSVLQARNDILLEALSCADLLASTQMSSGGFFGSGDQMTRNTLHRTTGLTLDTAELRSLAGSTELKASAGSVYSLGEQTLNELITTMCIQESAGVTADSRAYALTDIRSGTPVTIRNTKMLTARGSITVDSDSSAAWVHTWSQSESRAMGTDSEAFINVAPDGSATGTDLSAVITVEGSQLISEGIRVHAGLPNVCLQQLAYAFGGSIKTESRTKIGGLLRLNGQLNISYSTFRSNGRMDLIADAGPAPNRVTLKDPSWDHFPDRTDAMMGTLAASARTETKSCGDAYADIWLQEGSGGFSSVELGDRASFYGGEILVEARPLSWDYSHSEVTDTGAADGHTSFSGSFRRENPVVCNQEVHFYVGSCSAGLIFEAFDTPSTGSDWWLGFNAEVSFDPNAQVIHLGMLRQSFGGTLTVSRHEGWFYVHEAVRCEDIRITNHLDVDLQIEDILNIPLLRLSPTVIAENDHYTLVNGPEQLPDTTIRIESRGRGNLRFHGHLLSPDSDLEILFTGPEPGRVFTDPLTGRPGLTMPRNLPAAPIWVHSVKVTGAQSVGTPGAPFLAFLFMRDQTPGTLSVTAQGGIWLAPNPGIYRHVDRLVDKQLPPEALTGDPIHLIFSAVSESQQVEVNLGAPLVIWHERDSAALNLVLPGSLNYVDGLLVPLQKDVLLKLGDLKPYYLGFDSLTRRHIYRLSTGTELWLSEDRTRVLRVREPVAGAGNLSEYVDVALDSFSWREGPDGTVQQVIFHSPSGPSLTFTPGQPRVTVAAGSSFQVPLTSVDRQWLEAAIRNGLPFLLHHTEEDGSQGITVEGSLVLEDGWYVLPGAPEYRMKLDGSLQVQVLRDQLWRPASLILRSRKDRQLEASITDLSAEGGGFPAMGMEPGTQGLLFPITEPVLLVPGSSEADTELRLVHGELPRNGLMTGPAIRLRDQLYLTAQGQPLYLSTDRRFALALGRSSLESCRWDDRDRITDRITLIREADQSLSIRLRRGTQVSPEWLCRETVTAYTKHEFDLARDIGGGIWRIPDIGLPPERIPTELIRHPDSNTLIIDSIETGQEIFRLEQLPSEDPDHPLLRCTLTGYKVPDRSSQSGWSLKTLWVYSNGSVVMEGSRNDSLIGISSYETDYRAQQVEAPGGVSIRCGHGPGSLTLVSVRGRDILVDMKGRIKDAGEQPWTIEGTNLTLHAGDAIGTRGRPLMTKIHGQYDVWSDLNLLYCINDGSGIEPEDPPILSGGRPPMEAPEQELIFREIRRPRSYLDIRSMTEPGESLCAMIRAAMESSLMHSAYQIRLKDGMQDPGFGQVHVGIPVGAEWEGRSLLVLRCDGEGRHILMAGTVVNGRLWIHSGVLGDYVILDPGDPALLRAILDTLPDTGHPLEITPEAQKLLKAQGF